MSTITKKLLQECLSQGLDINMMSKRLNTSVGNVYVLLSRNGLSIKNGVDRAIAVYEYSESHGIDAAMERFRISRDNCHALRYRGRKKLLTDKSALILSNDLVNKGQ